MKSFTVVLVLVLAVVLPNACAWVQQPQQRLRAQMDRPRAAPLWMVASIPEPEDLVPTNGTAVSGYYNTIMMDHRVVPPMAVWQGRAMVLFAAAIYGTNFGLVKWMDVYIPPELSAVLRFGLAAVVVSAMVLMQEFRQDRVNESPLSEPTVNVLPDKRWQATWGGMEVGIWYGAGYLCQALGLMTVEASKSAFFNALAVVVVPVLDATLRDKPLTSTKVASIAMAMAGVALLEFSDGVSCWQVGDVWCALQAAAFGMGYWRLEEVSTEFPAYSARITAGQVVAVALGMLAWGHPSWAVLRDIPAMPLLWAAVAWAGLVSTSLALFLETMALQVVSASELTILMTSVSLWGSAFAFCMLGEVLPPVALIGGLAILSGCVLSTLDGEEEEQR